MHGHSPGDIGGFPYLDASILFPTQLDLTKLSFSNGVTQVVVPKSRCLFSLGVVVSTPATSAAVIVALSSRYNWWRHGVVVFLNRHWLMGLGLAQSLLLAFQIHLGL
jgi:hypothetical protein